MVVGVRLMEASYTDGGGGVGVQLTEASCRGLQHGSMFSKLFGL